MSRGAVVFSGYWTTMTDRENYWYASISRSGAYVIEYELIEEYYD